MVGRVNRAEPPTMLTREPSTAKSTGLAGSALVISESSRPETSTRPSSSASTDSSARVDTS